MRETYDASIGGRKGLLHVGHGAASGGDGGGGGGGDAADHAATGTNDTTIAGTTIRFVRNDDGEAPMSFDASRLLSCEPKGRYRMVVVWEDAGSGGGEGEGGEPGEKNIALVRVYGTAIDRVIGEVLDLAERAGKGEDQGAGAAKAGAGRSSAAGMPATAAAATTVIAAAPAGGTAERRPAANTGGDAAAAVAAAPPPADRAGDGREAAAEP